jgi:hypothetical protein
MIVRDEGTDLLLVTQTDHARFAGELLSLWRGDGLPDHPRRNDLLFAAREHDNGWRETDAAPRCNPETGRPYDFLELPRAERSDIWRRGTGRFETKRPYAALMITLHALAIFREPPAAGEPDGRNADEAWEQMIVELTERKERLLEATGAEPAAAAADYRFVDLADVLSLTTCNGWRDPVARPGLKARYDPEIRTLYLEPFPLAGATTFHVSARRIPKRRYDGDADLGGALAAARWDELHVRVAPLRSAEHLHGAATEPP